MRQDQWPRTHARRRPRRLALFALLLGLPGCSSDGATGDGGVSQDAATSPADGSTTRSDGKPAARDGSAASDGGAGPDDYGLTDGKQPQTRDSGPRRDGSLVFPDAGPPPPPPPAGSIKVAAIQYGPKSFSSVSGCADVNCGLIALVKQAAGNGATHIVTPEGVPDQGKYAELAPSVGHRPAGDPRWGSATVIGTWAKLATDLKVTLVFNVITQVGTGSTAALYNTEVVVNPDGIVLAVHFKFHLYGEKGVTPGTNCCDLFQTPAGKAGLLICADAQCVIWAMHQVSQSSCSQKTLKLMNDYVASKPRITFFSSYWMATGSQNQYWKPTTMMSDFAKYSGSYFVGANTIDGNYHGGGIFRPDGTAIETYDKTTPGIAYGVIPKP